MSKIILLLLLILSSLSFAQTNRRHLETQGRRHGHKGNIYGYWPGLYNLDYAAGTKRNTEVGLTVACSGNNLIMKVEKHGSVFTKVEEGCKQVVKLHESKRTRPETTKLADGTVIYSYKLNKG